MNIRILGICGSPIKGGNTEHFLMEALKSGEDLGVKTEIVTLSQKEVSDCQHCNWCLTHQKMGKYCALTDEAAEIFPKVLETDGLLVATPVYFGRLTGRLSNLIDRFRVFIEGNFYKGSTKDKVGGALAVAWSRHGGIETALLSIDYAFLLMEMIPVSVPLSGALYGGGGLSSLSGAGKFDPEDKLMVIKDDWGLKGARAIVRRMVELIRIVKAGKEVLASNPPL